MITIREVYSIYMTYLTPQHVTSKKNDKSLGLTRKGSKKMKVGKKPVLPNPLSGIW